jgi:acetyl-CoA carboxylase biotin carboxyl carrier protein
MAEITVSAEMAASVWKIEANPGTRVAAGDTLLILESMKMEIPLEAPQAGTVAKVLVAESDQVKEGQVVVLLEG